MPPPYATGYVRAPNKDHRQHRHGWSSTREYHSWLGMRQRCHNPKHPAYGDYGGRGIIVCEQWRKSFEVFIADMGPMPSTGHTLDRIDNDGPYSPENCRWATRQEQSRNRRSGRIIELNGEKRSLTEWAERYGMNPRRVHYRVNTLGWDFEKALTTPMRGHKPYERKGVS